MTGTAPPTEPLAPLAELRLAARQAALWRLGQSGFALRIAEQTVLLDPFLSEMPGRVDAPPFRAEEATGVSLIACSHEHLDHFDAPAMPALLAASPMARLIVPAPIVPQVQALGISSERIIGARPGEPIRSGSLTIHPIAALHGVDVADAYSFGEELSDGAVRYLGYVLDADAVRIFHAGDGLVYDGLAERLRELQVQVALLPINGREYFRESRGIVGNMDVREALELADLADVDVLVPMHHEMFVENLGYASQLAEVAARFFPRLSILMPTKGRPFIYTALPTRVARARL